MSTAFGHKHKQAKQTFTFCQLKVKDLRQAVHSFLCDTVPEVVMMNAKNLQQKQSALSVMFVCGPVGL